ncbi:MAG: OmpH family outer membrane protein [Flavobacteriaceae bacterium]|nr:OmpH family outer membrane protein [Flavobacteriaceae bacterium]
MKQFRTLLVIAIFALGFTQVGQAQKVAHINTEQLISSLPETKALNEELQKLTKTYADDIKAADDLLKAKYERFTAESAAQTDEENQKRMLEVQADQEKIRQMQIAAREELQKKEVEKLNPILEKAMQAINDVAKEKGIVYVFDSAPGKGLIVFDKGEDIIKDVQAKLGMTE